MSICREGWSYLHIEREGIVALGHGIVKDDIIVLREEVVHLECHPEASLPEPHLAHDIEVGGIPWLHLVIQDILLL